LVHEPVNWRTAPFVQRFCKGFCFGVLALFSKLLKESLVHIEGQTSRLAHRAINKLNKGNAVPPGFLSSQRDFNF
jgi:hypothetical protein